MLFRTRVGGAVWVGVALAVVGLAMLSGVGAGEPLGDLLVLLGSAAYSLQIVLMERYAPRYDPVAFTQSELLAAFAGFAVVAVALGQVEDAAGLDHVGARCRHGHLCERARLPCPDMGAATHERNADCACFRDGARVGRNLRLLAHRAGAVGWGGCALIMAGIVVAEPEAGRTLRRLVARA